MNRRRLLRVAALAGFGLAVGCRTDDRTDNGADQAADDRTAGEDQTTTDPDAEPGPAPTRPEASEPDPGPTDTAPPDPEDAGADEAADGQDREPRATARLEVICRDAIGLVPASAGGVPHRPERVMLHHTAVRLGDNREAPARLRQHQRLHRDAGWSDIAYHYGIDLAGNVYELRSPDVAGDTFTDYEPAGHLLLVCEGNYDVEVPTDDQLTSVAQLMAAAAERRGIDPATLTGHRDHAVTSCPGDHLYARLSDLVDEATRLHARSRVDLDLRCGEEARRRVAAIEASS